MKKQRIAFLYLNTGGGHVSAAKALAFRAVELYGENVEVFPFNPVLQKDHFARFLLQEGYRISSLKIEKFWIFIYEFNRSKWMQKFWELFVHVFLGGNLRRFLRENEITKIVVLHFLLITPAFRASPIPARPATA